MAIDKLSYYLSLSNEKINRMKLTQIEPMTKEIMKIARGRKKEEKLKLKELNIPLPNIYREYSNEKNGVTRLDFRLNNKKMESMNSREKRNYLLSEFYRAKQFLESETSTVSGWEDTIRRFVDTIERKTGGDFDFDEIKNNKTLYKKLFNIYNTLNSLDNEWRNLDSAQALKRISEYVVSHKEYGQKRIIKSLSKKASQIYKEQKEKERKETPLDVFSFDSDKV